MFKIHLFQLRYVAYLVLFTYSLLCDYDNDVRMKTHEIVLLIMVAEFTLDELFQVSFVIICKLFYAYSQKLTLE